MSRDWWVRMALLIILYFFAWGKYEWNFVFCYFLWKMYLNSDIISTNICIYLTVIVFRKLRYIFIHLKMVVLIILTRTTVSDLFIFLNPKTAIILWKAYLFYSSFIHTLCLTFSDRLLTFLPTQIRLFFCSI